MKTPFQKIAVVGVGMFLTMSVIVRGDVLIYNNSTTDTGNNLSLVNGSLLGSEILLGVPSATLTSFSYEIYSPNNVANSTGFNGNVTMEAWLYANVGTPFNGYNSPGGTALYDSGSFPVTAPLVDPNNTSGQSVSTLTFSGLSIPVPNDFTLVVQVSGLTGTDYLGMELFDPATVGANYGDYWSNTGSGWQLLTLSPNTTDFGSQFTGIPVPEPSMAGLDLVGGFLLAGLAWIRRRQDSAGQI